MVVGSLDAFDSPEFPTNEINDCVRGLLAG